MLRTVAKLLVTNLGALGLVLGVMTTGPNSGRDNTAVTAAMSHAAPAANATVVTCYDAPSNATCNGVSPNQGDPEGRDCWLDAYRVGTGLVGFDQREDYDGTSDTQYYVELWYSPTCGTNWSEVDASTYLGATFSTKVRRYAGPNGGYLLEHAQTFDFLPRENGRIYSPMVYAPANKAQACLSLPNNDQVVCTRAW
jgi:Protein of unknown function (DUF2690)